MILTEETIKNLPQINENEIELYKDGEFEEEMLSVLNNDFDKIDEKYANNNTNT